MEKGKDIYKKEIRKITVRTTDGSTLLGKVNIGIKERVSDLFTKTESPFIILFDVEEKDTFRNVLFVNKDSIIWVEPED